MKPFVRFTALILAVMFLSGAGLALFDVVTHENILTNPELKFAGGWLTTGLMLLALGMRGWRRRRQANGSTAGGRPPA
jgi:hypothetical protein